MAAILLVAGIATLLMLPAFLYSFPNGDDVAQHYWWTRSFVNEILDGAFYPRWLSEAYQGRGSPVMLYYPPLPFYATTVFYFLVGDPLRALLLGYWLALVLSGLAMYIFARVLFSPAQSLVAAAFYVAAHYHLFDFYHRSAQHEFWAFVWVPLILYGVYRVITERSWGSVHWIAISYSLLLMTHLPSSLIVTIMLPVFVLTLTRDLRSLIRTAVGLMVGAGMAAMYLLPYLLERGYLKPLGQRSEIQSFRAGFLLEDLPSAFSQIPVPSSGNFHLFILASNWMALGILVLLIACSWILWNSELKRNNLIQSTWIITVASFLMTTRVSWPFWRFVPKIKAIQFPIRWFVITLVGVSVLAAAVMALVTRRNDLPRFAPWVTGAAIFINLAIGIVVVARAPFQPEALKSRLSYYTDVREYHPKWWDQKRHAELDKAPAVVDEGSARVTVIDETGTSQSYLVEADVESVLRFRTLYFPGWQAELDGTPKEVSPSKEGHIELRVDAGEHTVGLVLKDTRPRAAGKIISGLSVISLGVLLYSIRGRKPGFAAPLMPQKSRQRQSAPSPGAGKKRSQKTTR